MQLEVAIWISLEDSNFQQRMPDVVDQTLEISMLEETAPANKEKVTYKIYSRIKSITIVLGPQLLESRTLFLFEFVELVHWK